MSQALELIGLRFGRSATYALLVGTQALRQHPVQAQHLQERSPTITTRLILAATGNRQTAIYFGKLAEVSPLGLTPFTIQAL